MFAQSLRLSVGGPAKGGGFATQTAGGGPQTPPPFGCLEKGSIFGRGQTDLILA